MLWGLNLSIKSQIGMLHLFHQLNYLVVRTRVKVNVRPKSSTLINIFKIFFSRPKILVAL